MNFYNNLKEICEDKGFKITPTVIKCGGTKGILSGWKNGVMPNSEIVMNLSVLLNVPTDILLFGKEKSPLSGLSADEQELLELYKALPDRERQRLIGRAELLAEQYGDIKNINTNRQIVMKTIKVADIAAGAGISTPFTIDNAFSPKKFPAEAVPAGADCGVPINGDSMEPKYPNGSIVWVKVTEDINVGDVIIAILNGEPYCKVYEKGSLHSYNKDYKPIKITEYDNFKAFGKVIGAYIE